MKNNKKEKEIKFPFVLRDCVLVEAIPLNEITKENKRKIILTDTNSVANKMYCGTVIQCGNGIVGDRQIKMEVKNGDFILYPASVGFQLYHNEQESQRKEYRIIQYGSIIAVAHDKSDFFDWSEHF